MHSDSCAERRLWEMEDRIRISQRIACPEAGYPVSEAKYATTQEWEKSTGKKWLDYINRADIQQRFYK